MTTLELEVAHGNRAKPHVREELAQLVAEKGDLHGIETWGGFHAEILKTPIRWEDGYVILPSGPGLGVELDEDVAERHPYEGDELHLVPLDTPVD